MNLDELVSYIKELSEEQKATQRAIALQQSKLTKIENMLDRFIVEKSKPKKYVEVGYR